MNSEKKKFLENFNDFIDSFQNENYGKCSFMSINGQEYQGWISEINDNTIEYLDSGPLARDEPFILEIDSINTKTLAYWDAEVKKWTRYFEPNKLLNRKNTKN